MKAREAQVRMVGLEDHGQDWNVEEFMRWIVGLDDVDADDVGRVVQEEVRRAVGLAEGYYQQITKRVAVLHPQMLAAIAFQQGMTFAAAALGREPFKREEQG